MRLLAALWRRLVVNWPIKLAAILVALVLWVYVLNQLDPIGERNVSLQVTAINVPQGLELLDIQPDTISVKLRGRQSLLHTAVRTLTAVVDCKGREVGESSLEPHVENSPPGVQPEDLAPPTVHVRLDLSVSAERRVTIRLIGLPAEGYQTGPPRVDPVVGTVRGPAGLVQRVARIVAPVSIDGLSTSLDRQIQAEARDDAGAVVPRVTVDPKDVHVVIPIQAVNVRVIPVYPKLSAPAAGYRIVRVGVRPAVVVLQGPLRRLRSVDTVSTEPLDISSLRGSATEPVQLLVPAGCHLVGVVSAEVTVTVEPLPTPPRPARIVPPPVGAPPAKTPPGTSTAPKASAPEKPAGPPAEAIHTPAKPTKTHASPKGSKP